MRHKMEQPAAIALPERPGREGWALEGLYRPAHQSDANAGVIAPPHPLYGGSMDSPVVSEIAFALEEAGLATLRFNWRGVGASAGEASGEVEDGVEDYAAALDFLEDTAPPPLISCGYSFGAGCAVLASRRPTVRRLALVSPPATFLDLERLVAFPGKVFIAVGDRDDFAPLPELESIAAGLKECEFLVLPETDHFFNTGPGLVELHRSLVSWLA